MSKVIANLDYLKALLNSSKSEMRRLLSSRNVLRCIQEIALNILSSLVPLTKQEYKDLSKSKTFLRRIGKKHISLNVLRRLVLSHLKVIPQLIVPTLRVYKVTRRRKSE
jgi:hypothetical protein